MPVTRWISRTCLIAVFLASQAAGAEELRTYPGLDPALDASLEAGIQQASSAGQADVANPSVTAAAPASGGIVAADAPVAPSPAATPAEPLVAPPGLTPVIPLAPPRPVAKASSRSASKAESDEAMFPHYAVLKPNVTFWTKVFSEYSENQSAIHSTDYPDIVFKVLDFRSEATYMDRESLRKLKNVEESKAIAEVKALLEQVHEARYQPETLQGEARRIFTLYGGVSDDMRFKTAVDAVRSQRGLKERTYQALQISGKYLPAMENVFTSYELPLRLTRLPLVESSFNVEAYSKVGAAGLWQFIPSSARIYMRLNDVVDDRRDPWTSTDAAARHLRDDYAMLGSWPLALTAYNHGRGGVARGLAATGGTELPDLIRGYTAKSFGFASRNFYAEFLAASDVERNWKKHFGDIQRNAAMEFEVVETKHYVPYETLRRMCNADDDLFRRLNPAYRPEVIEGKLYVPPGHLIRVPAGAAQSFQVAYATLGDHERFDQQRVNHLLHKVKRGETLSGVAKRYGITQASIRASNSIGKKGVLRSGQVLKIIPHREARPGPVTVAVGESKPGLTRAEKLASEKKPSTAGAIKAARVDYRTHKVRSGQTLSSIAKLYKVSIKDLRKVNGLGASSDIRVGEKIKVPLSQ